MASSNGLLSPTDLVIITDAIAGWVKYIPAVMGRGIFSEAAYFTGAYQAFLAQTKILGDGTTTYVGIQNSVAQKGLTDKLASLFVNSRYEVVIGSNIRTLIAELNSEFSSSTVAPKSTISGVTSQWNMSASGIQPLDAHLMRLNATAPGTPATPTNVPTLTAATGGIMGNVAAGSAPVMAYTFVGANDWLESQPSPVSTQVALSGASNAYLIGNLPAIPAGVTKIRLYRSLYGSVTPLFWDRDVPVVVGSTPSTLKFTANELGLRQDISPPLWAQCLVLPEFALGYSVCQMTPGQTSQSGYLISTSGLLSPSNVAVNVASGILGYNNPVSSGTLATWTSTVNSFGTMPTVNDTTQGLQGFLGGFAVQARTTSALDANASLTNVTYSYVTAASPLTVLSATAAGPFTLNLAAGSTVDLGIPAGRCVRGITAMTVSGSTTGTFLLEGSSLRVV
jgi:hypothetical protein